MFLNVHRSGVFIALAWLVPHETAAVSARSVYSIQQCIMSLRAKPHRSYPHLNALPDSMKEKDCTPSFRASLGLGLGCESIDVCTVCIWRCEQAGFCVEVCMPHTKIFNRLFIQNDG